VSESARLCIIEDDDIMLSSLRQRLMIEGVDCDCFDNATEALEALLVREYAGLLTDIRLPDMSGDKLFSRLLDADKMPPPTIFITGYGTIDEAVRLLKLGACDYITKPFDLDELLDKLRAISPVLFGDIQEGGTELGVSSKMRQVQNTLDRFADHNVDILITGESGVGKEYAAKYYANRSNKDENKPFIALNCAALPEDLLEAELFGHEKGAFTGATKARRGVFEQANGGILFLDEIGETSPRMQVKLLRSIQERVVQRVGSEEQIPVDLHIVYATNRDLKEMVADGTFREDLYFRINVAHVHIPPLRERKEDIHWLTHRILEDYYQEHNERHLILPLCERYLEKQLWPGNLRELDNAVRRACILSSQEVLGPREFGAVEEEYDVTDDQIQLKESIEQFEKDLLLKALERNEWRIMDTASFLGISRKSLWEKMKRHGITQIKE
jgi:DNA-binding NtrC family response regulator